MKLLSVENAFLLARRSLELNNCGAVCTGSVLENDVYMLEIRTYFQRYDCAVDAYTGEVLGACAEPSFDMNLEVIKVIYTDGNIVA